MPRRTLSAAEAGIRTFSRWQSARVRARVLELPQESRLGWLQLLAGWKQLQNGAVGWPIPGRLACGRTSEGGVQRRRAGGAGGSIRAVIPFIASRKREPPLNALAVIT